MTFKHWIHHLINPHCDECQHERQCKSCETLKEQLVLANMEKKQMLETILSFNSPPARDNITINQEPPKDALDKLIPWRVRRQMLEAEDRERARLMKESESRRIAELEEEVKLKE
jgi:hypothetical protein